VVCAKFRLESPDNGNQVNPRHISSSKNQSVAHASSNRNLSRDEITNSSAAKTGSTRRPAVLLDLSGDKNAALQWARERFGDATVSLINKADLKWTSKLERIRRVRALAPDVFSIFTSDLNTQSGARALMVFGVLAGASRVTIGDKTGRVLSRPRSVVIMLEAPRLALEFLTGYALLIPISWLLTELLGVALLFRRVVRASINNREYNGPSMRALYVRATISSASEGGMQTHVAGFASGAEALGHKLKFVTSGTQHTNKSSHVPPSRFFDANRVFYELWNNLNFTAKLLSVFHSEGSRRFDFIYQRYNRFNWSGVVLSILTGPPLALEFNGSEVWVSKQWDPIGQLSLLRRFERLNLRAADLVFVVSEVQRRDLIAAGFEPKKIIINPNGVDTDRFHPGCGGRDIRRRLGIESKTVVGFVGTFGPWHGAPVLAEAASLVEANTNCHFLFVGDGDERAQTEAIVQGTGVHATFTGRIPHSEIAAYLDACDVLVSPHVPANDGSEFFGSPTKLFEYMSMAKPVIASRLGQIAEVIRDGENGLLVEPRDAAALARAIDRLMREESLRRHLGAGARQTVIERYTWRHNASRVFDAMKRNGT
jgi:glycosyltransferase involved in cell wall biosynthesis